MVIISTSALDVSIQAVSPALKGSGGGAAASATCPVASHAADVASASEAAFFHEFNMQTLLMDGSKRVGIGFAGADAHHVIDGGDENLAITDFPGPGLGGDQCDDGLDLLRRHRDRIFALGTKFTAYSAPR